MAGVDSQRKESDGEAALKLTMPSDSLRSDEIWTIVIWCLLLLLALEMMLAGQVHA